MNMMANMSEGFNKKFIERLFRPVEGVVWDLMTGRVGVQMDGGIATIEGTGDLAQVTLNVMDQFGLALPAFAQATPKDAVKVGDLIYGVEQDKLSMDKRSEIALGEGCCDDCPGKEKEAPEEVDLGGFREFQNELEVVDVRTWPALPSTLDFLESGKCFAEMTIQVDNILVVANTWEAALNYLIKRGEPISRFYDFQQLG